MIRPASPEQGRLAGKAAIVTGAATGIGEAIAHKFAAEGASVVVNSLPDDPIDDVVARINEYGVGRAIGYAGDVADEHHAIACIERCIESFEKLDILINNAGIFTVTGYTDQYPAEIFDEHLRANVRSAFLMTRHALPHLRKTKGNIICAGSEAGMIGLPYNTPYGGTKGFLHAFAKGVAAEQGKYGIRCNCVCPGPIDTAWTRREQGPMGIMLEKTMISATIFGRRGTVEEVANVYAFLASDEASYVTGALWLVDGGITISKGPVAMEAKSGVSNEPEGEIDRRAAHTHEGLEHKNPKKL